MLANWTENHPAFRGDKTSVGERAADHMRKSMGSWPFVFSFMLVMGLWAVINTFLLAHGAFDPYPYILLNLFLSMLAGLQGAILLISAKRADAIAGRLAMHTDLQTTLDKECSMRVEKMVTEILESVKQSETNPLDVPE